MYGVFDSVHFADDNIIAYTRTKGTTKLLVICNFQNKTSSCSVGKASVLLDNYADGQIDDGVIALRAFEAVVLAIES